MNSRQEEAARILEQAADGFESGRYRWTKGVSYRKDSRGNDYYCATGALHYEAGLGQSTFEDLGTSARDAQFLAYRDADLALEQAAGVNPDGGVPDWNDYIAGNISEVIDKMKEAAKTLRNQP